MQINHVHFAGYVGDNAKDETYNGFRVVSFSLCQTEKYKDKETKTWMKCKVFGTYCDTASQIKTGDNVDVVGKLRTNSYTNKEGIKVTVTEINVSQLMIDGKKAKTDAAIPSFAPATPSGGNVIGDIPLEDVPF